MEAGKVIAELLNASQGMLVGTLADFSEADMYVRPCPGANHAAWQVGHLINAEHHLLSKAGAKLPALPADFSAKFNKETASSDDAKAFGMSKDQLLALRKQVRDAAMAWAASLSAADLDKPSNVGFAPTVGVLLAFGASHDSMHTGQFQVIRRKLGKPILF
jgi:hypothetical protein